MSAKDFFAQILGASSMRPQQVVEQRDALANLLRPLGLQMPTNIRENLFLPEAGTNNFFGRHPRATRGLENAIAALATIGPSNTTGEGIANVASSLMNIPQMREQNIMQQYLAPLQFAPMLSQIRAQNLAAEKTTQEMELAQSKALFENMKTSNEASKLLAEAAQLRGETPKAKADIARTGLWNVPTGASVFQLQDGGSPIPTLQRIAENPDTTISLQNQLADLNTRLFAAERAGDTKEATTLKREIAWVSRQHEQLSPSNSAADMLLTRQAFQDANDQIARAKEWLIKRLPKESDNPFTQNLRGPASKWAQDKHSEFAAYVKRQFKARKPSLEFPQWIEEQGLQYPAGMSEGIEADDLVESTRKEVAPAL